MLHRAFFLTLLAGLLLSCGGESQEKKSQARSGPASQPLHPGFSLTETDLAALLRDSPMPESTKAAAVSQGKVFLDLLLPVLDEADDYLILVDKKHALAPTWEPKDLADLKGLGVEIARPGLKLRDRAARALAEMARAAKKEGVTLVASSTYRSYEYQKGVYEKNVKQLGKEAADRESAMPGHSQHQLGAVVDFGSIDDTFAKTPASKWLVRRAADFGFSLSFPQGFEEVTGYRHESWHYRYVGKAAARLEREFFGGIQQYLLEFLAAKKDAFQKARK